MTPAAYIRAVRARLGCTQSVLAERLGVAWQHISRWERGIVEPRASVLIRLQAIDPGKRRRRRKPV